MAEERDRRGGRDDARGRPERSGERRSAGPRSGNPRADGPRSGNPRADGPRSGNPRAGGPRSGNPRADGPRSGGPRREPQERDREERRPKVEDVPVPEGIEYSQLDRSVRQRLRTLSKNNAEDVGRHLIAVALLIDEDPELAYRHAQVAVARAGRVDVVREAAALAAYATGRYAEALRELRTVRRLSGSTDHLAAEADCERGLGRPERAIALAKSPEAARLAGVPLAEMQIVVAGARLDMGEPAAALQTLDAITETSPETAARVAEARIDVLRELGRDDEAAAIEATLPEDDEGDEIVVFDVEEDDTGAEADDGAADDVATEDEVADAADDESTETENQ